MVGCFRCYCLVREWEIVLGACPEVTVLLDACMCAFFVDPVRSVCVA